MLLLKTDRLVPIITISLIAACSAALYYDFTRKYTQSRGAEIGVLTYKKKIAERRFAEEVLWESIDQNSKVFNCDYLRTTEGSGAAVHLKDNSTIDIGENTLVLVCYSDRGVQIGLDKGSIAARGTAGGKEMKITSGNASIKIKKGTLSVSKSKEGVNLSVSSGTADLSVGDTSGRVDSGSMARVAGNKLSIDHVSVRQVAPDINQYFVTAAPEQAVPFTWKTEGEQKVVLEVAKDSGFTAMAGTTAAAGDGAVMKLPGGAYYWRLVDGAGKTGPVRKFTVVTDRPAQPLSPAGGQQFSFMEQNPLIVFRWKESASASSYAVDISTDQTFGGRVLTLSSDTDSIATNDLGAGTYYWRVRSIYGFSPDASLISQTRQLVVARAAALAAPAQLLPKEGEALSDISLAMGSALFNWQGSGDYTGYDFRIARDREFKDVVYEKRVKENFHKPKIALAKGTYNWSVKGVTAKGGTSPASAVRAFTVAKAQAPGLLGPESGSAVNPLDTKEVTFRWGRANDGQRYRFELSRDRDFKKTVRSDVVTGSSHAIPTPAPGEYFWRVKLVGEGNAELLTSSARTFTVTAALGDPRGLYPVKNETVTVDSGKGLVFKWKAVEGATYYLFRLKHVVGAVEKTVLTDRVYQTQYTLKKVELLDAGSFTWEVSAVMKKDGVVSGQSRPERNQFSIKPGKLKAPKLKSDVIYVE